jgi:hypothetical protein
VLPEFCQSSLEARPSFEPIEQVLVTRRAVDPARLAHVFRHLHQASCYWLEGLT